MIGGGGEKVTLRITARYADEWNVWGDVETLRHKMQILDRHCEDVGRDPASIQRSAVALLFLSDDAASSSKACGTATSGDRRSWADVDEVREIVQAYRDAGVDELIVPDFTLGPMAQKRATLDRFIGEVAGPLR